MSVSVVKEGPYFSSGSISFAELRLRFKETSSGSISASELRRNTNQREENPVVPDSTENENISTGSNLRISQFRNSVKRYHATQTGTDTNAGRPLDPGFRMGRYDSSGRGIDWSGGGVNGRDGQNGGVTGNLTKNIQKFIYIRGTCGSFYVGVPAAQLAPEPAVYNVRFEIYGQILGAGGVGGYDPRGFPFGNQSGQNGGVALNIQYNNGGTVSPVFISSGARIFGGGGGGEQGQNGERGSAGTCIREYTVQSCGGNPGCNQGGSLVSRWSGNCCQSYCVGWPRCRERCSQWLQYATCRIQQTSSTPIQGIGGRGGNGQGYNQGRTSGQDGSAGTCPTCPSGLALQGGQCATNGKRGGDGGDWGQDGGETTGNRTRGLAGPAMAGSFYRAYGSINSNTVKGPLYGAPI